MRVLLIALLAAISYAQTECSFDLRFGFYSGQVIYTTMGYGFHECEKYCCEEERCQSFAYFIPSKLCIIRANIRDFQYLDADDEMVSGRKVEITNHISTTSKMMESTSTKHPTTTSLSPTSSSLNFQWKVSYQMDARVRACSSASFQIQDANAKVLKLTASRISLELSQCDSVQNATAKFHLLIFTESQKEAYEVSSFITSPIFLLQLNDEINDQEGVIFQVSSPEVEMLSNNPLPEAIQQESTNSDLSGAYGISIFFILVFCIVLNSIYLAWKRKYTWQVPEEVNRYERDDASITISDSYSTEEDQRKGYVDENIPIEVQINDIPLKHIGKESSVMNQFQSNLKLRSRDLSNVP